MARSDLTFKESTDNIQVTAPAKARASASSNRRVSQNLSQTALKSYKKPFLTYEQQLQVLIDRGLIINDYDFALKVLKEVNYYRLEGYWYSYYCNSSKEIHTFYPGTTFEDIWRQYCFDKEIRSLVFKAISAIEIAFRTQFAYELGKAYGPFPFKKENFKFGSVAEWKKSRKKLKEDIDSSKEKFVQHHKDTYKEKLLPIWAMVEIMSFGEISVWYDKHLKDSIKNHIAKHFGLPMNIFTSWIRNLSLVRNICAHHSRLWNKILPIALSIPTSSVSQNQNFLFATKADGHVLHKRLYNSLLAIQYLLEKIDCDSEDKTFLQQISEIVTKYRIDEKRMGVPVTRLGSLDKIARTIQISNINS